MRQFFAARKIPAGLGLTSSLALLLRRFSRPEAHDCHVSAGVIFEIILTLPRGREPRLRVRTVSKSLQRLIATLIGMFCYGAEGARGAHCAVGGALTPSHVRARSTFAACAAAPVSEAARIAARYLVVFSIPAGVKSFDHLFDCRVERLGSPGAPIGAAWRCAFFPPTRRSLVEFAISSGSTALSILIN